ncbi:hypothetical protein SynBIOSE41_00136 [Synechococcus sp. BIOS-E4-1]|nr:hypothetical protein SynBIOSE41_00136 [Synechococcus sp. BIOS-E4-1]
MIPLIRLRWWISRPEQEIVVGLIRLFCTVFPQDCSSRSQLRDWLLVEAGEKSFPRLLTAAPVVSACELLLAYSGKSQCSTCFLRSVFLLEKKRAVFTVRLLAWPDEGVDSSWPELRETPDAMPVLVSVENYWASDGRHALAQAAIAGCLFQQGCNRRWCVMTSAFCSVASSACFEGPIQQLAHVVCCSEATLRSRAGEWNRMECLAHPPSCDLGVLLRVSKA